jgi:hypothetical protein
MPAPFSSGASAADFPANEDPHCTHEVPKKIGLKPVLSKGIPVEVTCDEAGTQSLRVNILPKKFFRRYAKTKFRVLLGVKRDPDRPYHTSVDSGKVITVVR